VRGQGTRPKKKQRTAGRVSFQNLMKGGFYNEQWGLCRHERGNLCRCGASRNIVDATTSHQGGVDEPFALHAYGTTAQAITRSPRNGLPLFARGRRGTGAGGVGRPAKHAFNEKTRAAKRLIVRVLTDLAYE